MGESYDCMEAYGKSGIDKNSTRYTNELLEKILQKMDDNKSLSNEERNELFRIHNK